MVNIQSESATLWGVLMFNGGCWMVDVGCWMLDVKLKKKKTLDI